MARVKFLSVSSLTILMIIFLMKMVSLGAEEVEKRALLVASFKTAKEIFSKYRPEGEFLGSEKELRSFWGMFKIKTPLPSIDFSEELVLLMKRDANDGNMETLQITLVGGDIQISSFGTLVGYTRSSDYRINLLSINRSDVKEVGGVQLTRRPWSKVLGNWEKFGEVLVEEEPPVPVKSSSPLRNLTFSYFEGKLGDLKDLENKKALKSDHLTDNLMTSDIRERNEGYGIRYSGEIFVPQNGEYTFVQESGEDSCLSIAGRRLKGNIAEKVSLSRGVNAFTYDFLNPTGKNKLTLTWRGPGIDGEQNLVAKQRNGSVKVLASHKTLAVFKGIRYTWSNVAFFDIQVYLNHQRRSGRYGQDKKREMGIVMPYPFGNQLSQMEALYGGARSMATRGQVETINNLKEGDSVLLGWNHEYRSISRSRGPNYPVTLLRKVDSREIASLKKELEDQREILEESKISGGYYSPEAFAGRLIDRYPERFAGTIPEEFYDVQELNFKDLHLDEDDVISIGRLTSLKHLNFDGCEGVGEKIKHLVNLKNLIELNLDGAFEDSRKTEAGDSALAIIAKYKYLQKLNLSYARVSDTGIKHLSKLKELRHLILSIYEISDQGLAELSGCTKLESLTLEHIKKIKGPGFAKLKDLANLQTLFLRGGNFSEELFPNLALLTGLGEVDLRAAKGFSAKHIDSLAALVYLKKLNLVRPYHGQIEFTEDEVSSLRSALPECDIKI